MFNLLLIGRAIAPYLAMFKIWFYVQGCLELLSRSGISIRGKKAVVMGRSNIVGLPVSLLLLKADATVTIVHSRSVNPESVIREADIVIAAAGQAQMVCLALQSLVFAFPIFLFEYLFGFTENIDFDS